MNNETTTSGLSVRGEPKECYGSEKERIEDYARLLQSSADQGKQGSSGAQGTQGPQGPQGPLGPKGDKGDKGSQGDSGNIIVENGVAVFDNAVSEVTIPGKDLRNASLQLYTVNTGIASHPKNETTAINKVEYDSGTGDTTIRITVATFDEVATQPTSNLGVRWTLISTP